MHSQAKRYNAPLLMIALVLIVTGTQIQINAQMMRQPPVPELRFPPAKNVVEVPFEVESGYVVLPISVNGSRPLRFVLDTGASGAIIYKTETDLPNLKISGEARLRGAGGNGAVTTVPIAEDVSFKLGDIELVKGNLAILSSGRGHDGVIGRPVFANLVVEIDWEKQVVKFYEAAKFKYAGSGIVLPLTFDAGGRPYTTASVVVAGEEKIPAKLVVDTGGSHILSLDVGSHPGIELPAGATKSVLGRGASGELTGHSGRIKALEFAGQSFKDVPTIFPDSSSGTAGLNGRQGNLGSGILRRFNITYDYSKQQMILEPNKFARNPFGAAAPINFGASLAVDPKILPDYVGRYGNKEISIKDGALYYQRIGGSGAGLRAIGKDKFALNTDASLTFVRAENGAVFKLIIDWTERDQEELKREQPAATKQPKQTEEASVKDEASLAKDLAAFLEETAARDAFSGTVLVARNGKPIFTKAYGSANKTANTPNRFDTKFDLGSMNKMFTAVAVAQLVERGKLSFTDTVGKVLPDYPNKEVAEKVTIHQLLTHTSGMGNYFNEKFQANLKNLRTVADYLPLFAGDPLAFEPGSKWQYSNSGFTVLGLIIEKASGQSYYDYVKQHIFKPAGMTNTDSYERDSSVPGLAIGYMRMNDQGRPDPSVPLRENTSMRPAKGSPAGGGYSTIEDMLRFSLALYRHKLLSPRYTELVTTGKVETGGPGRKYAYGFGDNLIDGLHIVGHNGGGPGIGANLDIFPEKEYTAVILSNYSAPTMMPVVNKVRELVRGATEIRKTVAAIEEQQALTTAELEVRKVEREWLDAYERRDVEAIKRFLADEFKLTRSNGSVQTKADVLADLNNPQEPGRVVKFSTEDVQSRVEGEDVILTGRFILAGGPDGQTRIMQARYTDRYVKRDGRWQVVASQMARIR